MHRTNNLSIILFLLLAAILISGCAPAETLTTPIPTDVPAAQAQEKPVLTEAPACGVQQIRSGGACCADANEDGACDSAKTVDAVKPTEELPAKPAAQSTHQFNATIICKRSLLDGYVSCIPLWLPTVNFPNPTPTIMNVSVGFSGWDKTVITIPQLERKASQIQSLDGSEIFGYYTTISAGCSPANTNNEGLCSKTSGSWQLSLSADVPKWNENLASKTEEISVRVCTKAQGADKADCQDVIYSVGISLQK